MPMYFPHTIKRFRLISGYSQKDMAGYLGVAVSTYKNWELRKALPNAEHRTVMRVLLPTIWDTLQTAYLRDAGVEPPPPI